MGSALATGLISADTGGGYTACVDNTNGNTRIVADASACRATEHAIQLAGPTPGFRQITIDCAAGDDITQAIHQTGEEGIRSVDVVINGTCTQFVTISRDDVTLEAAHPGDGITAPDNSAPAISFDSEGRHVSLVGLTITGGQAGIVTDAALGLNNVTVSGSAGTGVETDSGGSTFIFHSTIDGAQTGVSANAGTVVSLVNSVISNSTSVGAAAHSDGALTMKNSQVTASGFQGVQVSNGGSATLANVTVKNSGDLGINVQPGASLALNGGTVTGNRGGIGVSGSADIQGHITTNTLFGVQGFGGRVEIHDSTIDANTAGFPGTGYGIVGLLGSRLNVRNTTIANNDGPGVELNGDSIVTFDNLSSSGNGGQFDVQCNNGFSSITGPSIAPATTNCPSS